MLIVETPSRASATIRPVALMMTGEKGNNMRKYKITAANKEHFESLIKDYRKAGFMLITLGNRVAELETDEEFIFIEY